MRKDVLRGELDAQIKEIFSRVEEACPDEILRWCKSPGNLPKYVKKRQDRDLEMLSEGRIDKNACKLREKETELTFALHLLELIYSTLELDDPDANRVVLKMMTQYLRAYLAHLSYDAYRNKK